MYTVEVRCGVGTVAALSFVYTLHQMPCFCLHRTPVSRGLATQRTTVRATRSHARMTHGLVASLDDDVDRLFTFRRQDTLQQRFTDHGTLLDSVGLLHAQRNGNPGTLYTPHVETEIDETSHAHQRHMQLL